MCVLDVYPRLFFADDARFASYKEQKELELESLQCQITESNAKHQEHYQNGLDVGMQTALPELEAVRVQNEALDVQLQKAKGNLHKEIDKMRTEWSCGGGWCESVRF